MSVPVGPYSPAVRVNDLVVTSGQIGIDEFGRLVSENFATQVRQALSNLVEVLHSQGLEARNVFKTTVYLTDVENFGHFNDLYLEVFGNHRPARSTVVVAALPLGALFEIEAWAHISD